MRYIGRTAILTYKKAESYRNVLITRDLKYVKNTRYTERHCKMEVEYIYQSAYQNKLLAGSIAHV